MWFFITYKSNGFFENIKNFDDCHNEYKEQLDKTLNIIEDLFVQTENYGDDIFHDSPEERDLFKNIEL